MRWKPIKQPPLTYKKYKCKRCGHERRMTTTHRDNLHSWGEANRCPTCKAKKIEERTVWVCLQK